MSLDHSLKDEGFAHRWNSIDWKHIESRVAEMQREITLAAMNGDEKLLRMAKRILMTSFEGRALAVRNVTASTSTSRPGLGESWDGDADFGKAMAILSDYMYESENSQMFMMYEDKSKKERLICIPTFYDRALQDLYLLAEAPAQDPVLDRRLFSSRKGHSMFDACAEVKFLLSGPEAPEWILKCDVKSFYDTIDHQWLLDHSDIDRDVLMQMLDPGRIRKPGDLAQHVDKGVPTGNRLSPILGNLILNGVGDGLQNPDDPLDGVCVRWVDDILITARTEEDAQRYLGHVIAFLQSRKLSLNMEKTYIANTRKGFEFLKYRFTRIRDNLEIYPSQEAIEDFKAGVDNAIERGGEPRDIVKNVNARLRGFIMKYRIANLDSVCGDLDAFVFGRIIRWFNESMKLSEDDVRRRFVMEGTEPPRLREIDGFTLKRISDVTRITHPRLCLNANPFLDQEYFRNREMGLDDIRSTTVSSKRVCAVCGLPIQYIHEYLKAVDNDGAEGYVHASCWVDTEYSKMNGHFRKPISERSILGTPVRPTVDEPVHRVRREIRKEPPAPVIKKPAVKPVFEMDRRRASKFDVMTDHLLSRGNEQELMLTFKQIEGVLEFKLPSTYRSDKNMWTRKGQGLQRASEAAGWSVRSVDMEKEVVWFRHRPPREDKFTPAEKEFLERLDPLGKEARNRHADALKKSRFRDLTKFLLSVNCDQILLSFKEIEGIIRAKLPESAHERKLWDSRKPGTLLMAIEDGEFEKISLDLKKETVHLVRVYCVPEPEKDNVDYGRLKIKPTFAGYKVR